MDPVTTLYERETAPASTLPETLATFYGGGLVIADGAPERPTVIANFVETVDGVVSYDAPGTQGGGPISGDSEPDHAIMGLLRARADAVIFGAGSLRLDAGHVRVPSFIYPPFAREYAEQRAMRGPRDQLPLSVVVTASGEVDFDEPTFHFPGLRALIATTAWGAARLAQETLPTNTEVFIVPETDAGMVAPEAVLRTLGEEYGVRVALHEGGPALFTAFLAAGCVDELFLTFAPQLAGRDAASQRLSLVQGRRFAPEQAPWGEMLSVKRAGSHLFLRYGMRAER